MFEQRVYDYDNNDNDNNDYNYYNYYNIYDTQMDDGTIGYNVC